MTESELVLAVNSMPLGQRIAFVEEWAEGMADFRTFNPADPIRDIYAMQRALLSALALVDGMGFAISAVRWVDPMSDPLAAIEQAKHISGLLLNSPDFQAAVGGAAITVH